MNDLFSTEVTNEMILKSFDSLYSVLKEADLIIKSGISSGDVIKIEPTK